MKSLSLYETRVLGCLIEKSLTTPDQYPLTLNALTSACNQKSNRDPVLDLAEAQVEQVVEGLIEAGLVTRVSGWGSRVPKYQHRFCNTEFSELQLSPQEVGILCVLFVRGPQTSSELRTRTQRLCTFSDVLDVEKNLHKMMNRSEGPLLEKLGRLPGQREARYAHLLGESEHSEPARPVSGPAIKPETGPASIATSGRNPAGDADRIRTLELRVEQLEQNLNDLQQLVNELL